MSPGVDLTDPLTGHMGVELGRGDTRMTEQLLDDSQVRPTFEQMRGKGMPQRMGADRLRKTSRAGGRLHDRERLLSGEAAAAIAQKQRSAAERGDVGQGEQGGPALGHPAVQPVECDVAHRYQSLLVALADDANEAASR